MLIFLLKWNSLLVTRPAGYIKTQSLPPNGIWPIQTMGGERLFLSQYCQPPGFKMLSRPQLCAERYYQENM